MWDWTLEPLSFPILLKFKLKIIFKSMLTNNKQ